MCISGGRLYAYLLWLNRRKYDYGYKLHTNQFTMNMNCEAGGILRQYTGLSRRERLPTLFLMPD